MMFPRQSGILLHPTSLPAGHGVGDFGPAAIDFLDFLASAGQTLWQMLPLGPTGYGDSPYQTLSVFAGNPLLISLDLLVEDGLLSRADLAGARFREGVASYEAAAAFKLPLLAKAAERATLDGWQPPPWLEEFALYLALKQHHNLAAWAEWEPPYRDRDPAALDEFSRTHAPSLQQARFAQWAFFRQWDRLRAAALQRGIRLMGDIPIYAAWDSADVWSAPHYWHLDAEGRVALQSGVPPDYFSATGQLWGNPIYRWDVMAQDGFQWWIGRFRAMLAMFDFVRVDHFRGFEAYWAVPGGHPTAEHGEWLPGPGAALFEALQRELGSLPVLAENLGVITPQVEALRERFAMPGMAILQFAFGKDPQAPSFKPHNYPRSVVAYSGTHDNDTVMGWWTSTGGDSTRTAEEIRNERAHTLRYLGLSDGRELNWHFIRALLASVANTVIFPAQDLLGLGSQARMNQPATLGGNWLWRLQPGELTPEIAGRLRELTRLYDR
jgi:4-alpha-glucanotransferase